MDKYAIDFKKLYDALDKKRTHRFGKLSWKRIGTRIHIGESTLSHLADANNISGNSLVNILMYLNKPVSELVSVVEPDPTYDDADNINEEKEV